MLKPKKRITKQEIERDPVLEKTMELEKFIRQNSKTLAIAAGAVALVIIVAIFMIKANKQKSLDASGKLGLAQISYQRGDVDDATLRLEELVEDFNGTESAGAGLMMLGQIHIEKGDYETAATYYADYVGNYDDDLGKASAYKALGVCAESKGNWEEAVDYYKKAIKAAKYKFQKQLAQISLIKANIELKNFEAAQKVLAELQEADTDQNISAQVDMLSAKLAVLEQ
jgi:outer membrane protein assembly factor BamD (BamD/ComL family)